MKLSNDTYDFLKSLALSWLPALATLYMAVSKIWGLPYGAEISGTIMAVDTFLGVVLGISTANYWEDLEDEEE